MTIQRILLIDDEQDIHTVVQIGLEMEAGWEVMSAISSDAGINLAIAEQPDVILLDAMMPQRDGAATLEILKATPATQHIPIIFLTAKAQASDRRRFYQLGAQGVILKPFDPTTLASQILGFLPPDSTT